MGSVVSKLRPPDKPVFSYVTLGDLRHFGNNDSMGQNAGCLGKVHDPFTVPFVRPMNGALDLQGVASLMTAVDGRRLTGRRQLLEQMNRAAAALETTAAMRNLDDCTRRACELLVLAGQPRRLRSLEGAAARSATATDPPRSPGTACWRGGSWRRASP